jgi:uncharacterized phage infection (PIP) family protein YhgE
MSEQNQARDLVATLRDALQKLEASLGRTRDGVGELRQSETTAVGIEMFVDAAVDLLEAFRALEAGLLDVQAEVDSLEAAMEDDEDGQQA